MGALYVSASRAGMEVALKAPAIVRRYMFCRIVSLLVEVFDFSASFSMCHKRNGFWEY